MPSSHLAATVAPERAIVLLSGGLDSSTALAMTVKEGREVHALTIDYGQRHHKEIEAAKKVAKHLGVRSHKVLRIDLADIAGSALTDKNVRVPTQRTLEEMGRGIPVTYVPARNTIFLGLALAYGESIDADEIVIAANWQDSSGYPDCRPEFYRAFAEVARLGTKRGVEGRPIKVVTPVIAMTKADIVRKGEELGVPWRLTWSCYLGGEKACGVCDSCQLRLKGFKEAGVKDPLPYARRAQTL
ncbi:MAG: 7-cyano-7-deazaguanine synthase QueC [Methanobacteriota archaeon]|nr:MAG: 7-cyano-7-deazaguanine synthase QueC [Euryarchaeota archaeon]